MKVVNLAFGLIAMTVSSTAHAAVAVLGPGPAFECFEAAKTGLSRPGGLKACNVALDENLSLQDRFATLVNRGVVEYASRDARSALADFAAGIALQPDIGDAYIDRGIMLAMEKRFAEALEDFNKGVALRPGNAYLGYYNRAVIEERLGNILAAYRDYQEALSLQPQFVLAADQLKRFRIVPDDPKSGSHSSP